MNGNINKLEDLIGKRFGRLIVISKDKLENGKLLRWICQCDCGKTKNIRGVNLKNGLTTSCGCYCRELHWKGYGDISSVYWSCCKHGAKQRGWSFNVTIEYAWELFLKQNKQCLLTGRPIKFVRNYSKDRAQQTASLDRIDSNIGYEIGNICWLDQEINFLKSNIHSSKFIEVCKEVARYQTNKSNL